MGFYCMGCRNQFEYNKFLSKMITDIQGVIDEYKDSLDGGVSLIQDIILREYETDKEVEG